MTKRGHQIFGQEESENPGYAYEKSGSMDETSEETFTHFDILLTGSPVRARL